MKLLNEQKLEEWLKKIHKKYFSFLAKVTLSFLMLAIISGLIGWTADPKVNIGGFICHYALCIFILLYLPVFILAITGLKKDWVEKPHWFKDNLNL